LTTTFVFAVDVDFLDQLVINVGGGDNDNNDNNTNDDNDDDDDNLLDSESESWTSLSSGSDDSFADDVFDL
jgi:hypothetical protein